MKISTLLFDLGNVLASWDTTPRTAEYARLSGLSPDTILDRLAHDEVWQSADRGLLTRAEMESRLNELLGCTIPHEVVLHLEALCFNVRPEMIAIAQERKGRFTVGILTNNSPLLRAALPRHFPELVNCFDPILFSHQFGHVKPEKQLFEGVQKRLNISAESILFFDDTPGHIAAALDAGWNAFLYESPSQVRSVLRNY